jgi:hypothetical protein
MDLSFGKSKVSKIVVMVYTLNGKRISEPMIRWIMTFEAGD